MKVRGKFSSFLFPLKQRKGGGDMTVINNLEIVIIIIELISALLTLISSSSEFHEQTNVTYIFVIIVEKEKSDR